MLKRLIHLVIFFLGIFVLNSCVEHSDAWSDMNKAYSFMEEYPDSALYILDNIDTAQLLSKEEKARHSLLLSMAYDKNYIDTTDLSVLKSAIEYYKKNGSPDEKLRMFYYQGRIYQNMGADDLAMKSFINAIDQESKLNDTLTLARVYAARGRIYKSLYNYYKFAEDNLRASNLFKTRKQSSRFYCLLSALEANVFMNNKNVADSILSICLSEKELPGSDKDDFNSYYLVYLIKYGTDDDLKGFLNDNHAISTENDIMHLANAYIRLGDAETAKDILDYLKINQLVSDSVTFNAIGSKVNSALGKYKEAYEALEYYVLNSDSIKSAMLEQDIQTSDLRHTDELKVQKEKAEKVVRLWVTFFAIVIITAVIFILILIARNNRVKKELIEERMKVIRAENESLREGIYQLQTECDELKNIISTANELPEAVRHAIKERIEMLNVLLARDITKNEKLGDTYDNWIKELLADKKRFIDSNRLAFQASHPNFIKYFMGFGLTDDEIGYVCLYAIGLKGKEVGAYMQLRSHVNISSAIRKKLGIDKHETNIGIFVRKKLKEL